MVFAVLVHARVTDILIKLNIGKSVLLQTFVPIGAQKKKSVCSYFLTQAIAISFGADNVLFFMSQKNNVLEQGMVHNQALVCGYHLDGLSVYTA
jgi:hypothetical protein